MAASLYPRWWRRSGYVSLNSTKILHTYLWRSLWWSFPSAIESPAMITRTTRRARSSSRQPDPMRPAKKEKSNLTALEEGPSP